MAEAAQPSQLPKRQRTLTAAAKDLTNAVLDLARGRAPPTRPRRPSAAAAAPATSAAPQAAPSDGAAATAMGEPPRRGNRERQPSRKGAAAAAAAAGGGPDDNVGAPPSPLNPGIQRGRRTRTGNAPGSEVAHAPPPAGAAAEPGGGAAGAAPPAGAAAEAEPAALKRKAQKPEAAYEAVDGAVRLGDDEWPIRASVPPAPAPPLSLFDAARTALSGAATTAQRRIWACFRGANIGDTPAAAVAHQAEPANQDRVDEPESHPLNLRYPPVRGVLPLRHMAQQQQLEQQTLAEEQQLQTERL